MKQISNWIFIICLLVFIRMSTLAAGSLEKNNTPCEMYVSTVQHLIFPEINIAVKEKYGKFSNVDIYDISIIDLQYDKSGNIVLTAQFQPYIGPHNSISKDEIKLLIEPDKLILLQYKQLNVYSGSQ